MCGIFGVFGVAKAAELTVIGLHGNQHRAIDFAGIVSSDGVNFYRERGPGIARNVFSAEMLDRLHGRDALGHIRYPTVTDDKTRDNTQPIVGLYKKSFIAIAHNGNLTNVNELRAMLPGAKFATSMDTECILRLLESRATSCTIEEDLASVCALLRGSYTLGILLPDRLIALQGPEENHPLTIGRLADGYCISSETCAFPGVGATILQEVQPGTMVSITKESIRVYPFAPAHLKMCRFESIYYSHPGSEVFGESVADFRMKLGMALEESAPVPGADIVIPVPDSANFIALGFSHSQRSGVFMPVIYRSHYAGRTFIAATQALRDVEVAQKFGFGRAQIDGKSIVVVDDSIVRGTTLPKIVDVLWNLGAREVHVRIGSPPIKFPCRYGINTPTREELISALLDTSQLRKQMKVTSLEFTPLEVLKSLSPDPGSYCFSCMTGEYW